MKGILGFIIIIIVCIYVLPILFNLIVGIIEIGIVLFFAFVLICIVYGILESIMKIDKQSESETQSSREKFEDNIENSENNIIEKSEYIENEKFNTKIVGVSFDNRQTLIKKLKANEKIFIIRDYNNKYDNNAIAVLNENLELLGYLAKNVAKSLVYDIDNFHCKYTAKVYMVSSKYDNYGAVITLNKEKYDRTLECIKWEGEIYNGVKDIYTLGLDNTNIRDEFQETLSNTKYYRSTYMCPNCLENLLYKIKSRGVITTYNSEKINLFNIFTCQKCKMFFASKHNVIDDLYHTSITLRDYALKSKMFSDSIYSILLYYTNTLYNDCENNVNEIIDIEDYVATTNCCDDYKTGAVNKSEYTEYSWRTTKESLAMFWFLSEVLSPDEENDTEEMKEFTSKYKEELDVIYLFISCTAKKYQEMDIETICCKFLKNVDKYKQISKQVSDRYSIEEAYIYFKEFLASQKTEDL
ncbi:HIRAN domain-containing protein [Clostridium celatum]|uniref:HIRAN domain-containing protein n=1 Tax=Clostridium celatum TaxID=36834 RepID=UPI001898D4D2|nr:HIRAN domain-containing protein [Clostridium celatum]